MTDELQRKLNLFWGGEHELGSTLIQEALRRQDYDLAQQILDTIRTGFHKWIDWTVGGPTGRLVFHLRGPKGAMTFMCMISRPVGDNPMRAIFDWHFMAADVGWHSPEQVEGGYLTHMGDCPSLGGGDCFYDGSGMAAEQLLADIYNDAAQAQDAQGIEDVKERVFAYLEERYRDQWGDEGLPQ